MRLTLAMLRCPPEVAPETRVVDGGEFSIGRGPDNDWVLADPHRHLSKRHCVLAFRAGGWQVADLSANGTFLNGEADSLGVGTPRRVRDGDRLRFGAFEVELQLTREREADTDPFSLDPFASGAFSAGPATPEPLPRQPIGLPADFDPLAPDPANSDFANSDFSNPDFANGQYRAPVQRDHSPATSDAFHAGSVRTPLPADWADDLLPTPPASPTPPAPSGPPTLPADNAAPRSEPPHAGPPEPPRGGPLEPPRSGPHDDDAGLLAAFLRGAGMADVAVADPAATMEQIGHVMRELVTGLRRALIARAAVKGEFRIEQTMISARGNNPLKFAADDEDALTALVGGARRTNMAPAVAVADALRDLRLHELAVMSAMQSAVRSLIASLDPAVVKREAEAGRGLPLQRKARAWETYETLHARVSRSLMDDFDSVFGKSFARAYEQAQAEIAGREGER